MKNRVLVIIVTYNGIRWIDRCLGSLRQSTEPVDVFVVDNGSTDGTPSRIRETGRQWFSETSDDGRGWWIVELVEPGANLGFGKANNLGLRYALDNGYDYVYLLNQDAWVMPDTIATMISAFEGDGTAGGALTMSAAGGRGHVELPYGVLSPVQMTASGKDMDPRFKKKCARFLPDLSIRLPGQKDICEVPFVMAAHWMISRRCLEAVGGFSPSFPHYGEDDNFLHRCLYHGFRCGICVRARAVHDRELRPMDKAARMRLKYVASVVKVSDPRAFLPWRLVRQPLELLAISVMYASPDTFAGIFRLMRSYPSLVRNRKTSRRGRSFL